MIYVLHGDDQLSSRSQLNNLVDQNKGSDIFKVDNKNIDLDQINNFINGQSLFATKKLLVMSNFFSIPKAILDKLTKVIQSNSEIDLIIWQDKKLNATQLKVFPKANVQNYPLDQKIFICLNNLRPGNLNRFFLSLHQVFQKEPFELLLFWLKFSLRKQLTTYSKFNISSVKRTYLQLLELEFQIKTGQLAIDKEVALERILINLFK